MSAISSHLQEFSLYVYLIHKWFDYRLKNVANVTTVLTGKDIEFIWTPDTYCLNARQSDLMMPDDQSHSMIRLYKTGLIVYSRGYVPVHECKTNRYTKLRIANSKKVRVGCREQNTVTQSKCGIACMETMEKVRE